MRNKLEIATRERNLLSVTSQFRVTQYKSVLPKLPDFYRANLLIRPTDKGKGEKVGRLTNHPHPLPPSINCNETLDLNCDLVELRIIIFVKYTFWTRNFSLKLVSSSLGTNFFRWWHRTELALLLFQYLVSFLVFFL